MLSQVNVAPSSDTGHFVKGADQVVNLDEINETFWVDGSAEMVTENHTTLKVEGSSMVTCQQVVNPVTKMYEKVRD